MDLIGDTEDVSHVAEAIASVVWLQSAFPTAGPSLLPVHSATPENHWQRKQSRASEFPQHSIQPRRLTPQIASPHTEPHICL